jgi:hypothetical protein
MKNSNYALGSRQFLVLNADRFKAFHRPRAKTGDRSLKRCANPGMRLELADALNHGFPKAKSRGGRVLLHEVIPKLADDVIPGAREDFNSHRAGFRAR